MDLKKEIKLSDLFKRRAKPSRAEKAPAAAERAEAPSERASFLRKDFQLPFGRAPKEPVESQGQESARPPKPPRRRTARGREAAPPALPAVPLMRAFNLLPRDDPRQAVGRRPSPAQLALAVAALVVIAALASMFLILNARVADKQQTYDDLREQLAARAVPVEEPQQDADPALVKERQERTTALASALATRIAWDRLLREFSLVLPEDVWLISLTAQGTRPADPAAPPPPDAAAAPTSSFLITGYTREQDGVARLLARLAVLPELSAVQLLSSTRTMLADEEVVEFSISATVKAPVGGAA